MKYIGIDLWNKRVWIAVSNQGFAFARETVGRTQLISYLKKLLIQEWQIEAIVVWLPYDLYGKDTRQLDKTQNFMEKLQTVFPEIPVVWHDERFSSMQASEWFDDHRDDIAAQCILQSYLDTKK